MAPSPTTQQDLDALERIGKTIGALAIIGGTVTALTRWLRTRRSNRERLYAERIERIVRAAFARELENMNGACSQLGEIRQMVAANTAAIGDTQRDTIRTLQTGDEILDQLLTLVRDNRDWLHDLQTFTDHVHGIDRRDSIGQDRRQRIEEGFDQIQDRRHQRRRVTDHLREQLDATRERQQDIDQHREVE
jgi:chromosome segregation ATPase